MAVISLRGYSHADLVSLLQALVNRVHDNPGLAVGGTTTKVNVANTFQYCVADKITSFTAADNNAVAGLTNTSATEFRKVRVEVNAAGTLSFKEGPAATAQALAQMPRRTASKATLGWIEIPASFTYGTSNFNDSGVTFFNGDPDLGDGAGVPPDDRGIEQVIYGG